MKIGDEVYIHGYVDEIRQNVVIIRNEGGYFGTVPEEIRENTCGDAISRQAVDDAIYDYSRSCDVNYQQIMEYIEKIPSVTPQPRMGRWIAQDIHNCHTGFRCSECGYVHSFMHLYGEPTADYTYCPQCGAKMEVEDAD